MTESQPNVAIGAPQPSPEFCTIVVVGMMNPAIHHPSWYHSMDLISDEERDAAVSAQLVIMQQVSQFAAPDFAVVCVPNRWEIQTQKFAVMHRILNVAKRVFTILDHTPVTAFGFNFHFHRETSTERIGDRLASAIKHLPLGLQALSNAEGQLVVTSSLPNRKKTVTVAQSVLGENRAFGGFNFHYDIAVTQPGAHFDMAPLLGPAAGHFQFIGSLDAIQNRHGNISDDDICLEFHCRFKQGLAVAHPADNFEGGFQETDYFSQQEGMVICQ